MLAPINFAKWIEAHRSELKPPVGNKQVWEDREFMVTVVGGPNSRRDYHVNEGEEFFHQLEGEIALKVIENGVPREIPLHPGEIFLLPPRVPHSPQRPAGTLGLVIERRRLPHERDGFLWFCPKCHRKVHEEFLFVKDLVRDLPPVFDGFYGDPARSTCGSCGTRVRR